MEDCMNVQIVAARPSHQQIDDFRGFSWIVDVIHQVSYSIDDDKTDALVLSQGIVYDRNA